MLRRCFLASAVALLCCPALAQVPIGPGSGGGPGGALTTPLSSTAGGNGPDLNPAIDLPNFMATAAPVVCFVGDSTTTTAASNVTPLDLLYARVEQRMTTENPNKTITFLNYAIAGTTLPQFYATMSSGWPTWWTNHSLTWAQQIGALTPACTTVFLNFGINGPGQTGISSWNSALNAVVAFPSPPDIVLITNGIGNPLNAINSPYQPGFRTNASLTRTVAHNASYMGIAGLPPIGLIDLNRVEAEAIYGQDPVDQVYTTISVPTSPASTFPYSLPATPDGDLDVQFSLSDAAAWYTSGATLTLSLADASGGSGGTSATQVNIRSSTGTNCNMGYYGGAASAKTYAANSIWPSSGPVAFRVSTKNDHIQFSCNGTIVGDFFAPKMVGPFIPTFSFSGGSPTETLTVTSYSPGTSRQTPIVMDLNTFWGTGTSPSGGDGARHPSSYGLNLVYGQAIEAADFRSTLPIVASATGLTAAGTTQATALALRSTVDQISTCAGGAGVLLWGGVAGLRETITNNGASACNVYPPAGAAINGGTTNAAYSLAVGSTADFVYESATAWVAK